MKEIAEINEIATQVLDCCFHVHSKLGPGLLESAYQEALCKTLENRSIKFDREVILPLYFDGEKLARGYRVDILVEKCIVIELKAVQAIDAVHISQVITYLKAGNFPLGYLINFNVTSLKFGIKRLINSQKKHLNS